MRETFLFVFRVRSLETANAKVYELIDGQESDYIVTHFDGYIDVTDIDGNKVMRVVIVD